MTGLRVACVLAVWAALLPAADPAGEPDGGSGDGLSSLSLEELTNLTVSSVSRRNQQLSKVAAAAYIITDEEIRRSGLTSIPELLRRVPGVYVARLDSNQWAVTSRGFGGRFANKMLVLIDGRSVYNNAYSGVYWEQNDVLLEDVERIEVIRGPGATMWGANAVNGVINIITKKARATHGGLVETRAGGDERGSGAIRYGGSSGDRMDYRAYAKYDNRRAFAGPNGIEIDDAWNAARGGGRLDWEAGPRDFVSFSGDVYRGRAGQLIDRTFNTPFPTMAHDNIDFSGGFAMGRWERTLRSSDVAIQTYYNDERRTEWLGGGELRTFDFDFQQHAAVKARHDLIWGGGYRLLHDDVTAATAPPFNPASRTDHLISAFLQDDVTIVPDRFVVTLGSKILHNSYTGVEVQPGARLLWTPSRRHTAWASIARAVRTPSRRDTDLRILIPVPIPSPLPVVVDFRGNPDFVSETLLAYEGGYRAQLTRRVSVDVAAYFNTYRHLEQHMLGVPHVADGPDPVYLTPLTFANLGWGNTYGVESSLAWNVNRRWRVQAGHAWACARLKGPQEPIGRSFQSDVWLTPRNTYNLISALELTRRIRVDAALYVVSRLPDRSVPGYARLDVHGAYRIGETGELGAGVENVGAGGHLEFSAEEYSVDALIQQRAYIQARWKF